MKKEEQQDDYNHMIDEILGVVDEDKDEKEIKPTIIKDHGRNIVIYNVLISDEIIADIKLKIKKIKKWVIKLIIASLIVGGTGAAGVLSNLAQYLSQK